MLFYIYTLHAVFIQIIVKYLPNYHIYDLEFNIFSFCRKQNIWPN